LWIEWCVWHTHKNTPRPFSFALLEREREHSSCPLPHSLTHNSPLAFFWTHHMAGIRDENESLQREIDRLGRNIERRHGIDIKSEDNTSDRGFDTDLHFILEGLPAEPSDPIQLIVNNDQVYTSGQASGDITAQFSAPIKSGFGNQINVTLKIPVMGFDQTKKYSLSDGFNFKFAATAKGLSILHQQKPF